MAKLQKQLQKQQPQQVTPKIAPKPKNNGMRAGGSCSGCQK
jgi:hypothetical protein